MKKNNLLLAVIFLITSLSLSAQVPDATTPALKIDGNYCLTFTNDAPLQQYYTVDVGDFYFEDEAEAIETFRAKSTNLITFSLDYVHMKVQVELHNDRLSAPKDKVGWSDYMKQTCAAY